MDKIIEKLEWETRVLELEMKQLQTSMDLTALALKIAEINRKDEESGYWVELNNKQDQILRLNREALAE